MLHFQLYGPISSDLMHYIRVPSQSNNNYVNVGMVMKNLEILNWGNCVFQV